MPGYITVSLEDARFHARHGVFYQERAIGNEFSVSASVSFPCQDPFGDSVGDDIGSTISYADIHELVRQTMKDSCDLLETVCARIADAILHRWPHIERLEVTVRKMAPPIPCSDCTASATITWQR